LRGSISEHEGFSGIEKAMSEKIINFLYLAISHHNMETITISRNEYEQMRQELQVLRDSKVYKRLLEFEKNIEKTRFTRKDLGF